MATTFDGLDQPLEVKRVAGGDSDDEVTRNEFYPGGQPRSTTNAGGATTTYTLDGLNRVIRTETIVEGETLVTTANYDANGNKTNETDRRGVQRVMKYDALNRLSEVTIPGGLTGEGPVGVIATYGYDPVGNKTSETNVAGLVTDYVYDGLYRVTEKRLPEGNPRFVERFAYDKVGNRTSVKDANGNGTKYAYDGLDRVIRTENALGHVATATFLDPEGSKVNKSEDHDVVRGLRTTYAYDFLNRETSRTVHLEGAGSSGENYTRPQPTTIPATP